MPLVTIALFWNFIHVWDQILSFAFGLAWFPHGDLATLPVLQANYQQQTLKAKHVHKKPLKFLNCCSTALLCVHGLTDSINLSVRAERKLPLFSLRRLDMLSWILPSG